MPTYNRKNIVMQAIRSVLDQTWINWHLYVVDDFSEDGTYEYLKTQISDPRISLFKSKHKGVCGARNTAIAHLKNEDYVAYLDSDNTWNSEYLELMLCRMLETNTCCCYGALRRFRREKDGSAKTIDFVYLPYDVCRLREFNFIDMNVFMHRSSVFKEIGMFDTSIHRMVDWELILRCAERYSFSRLPYVGCNYDHSDDASRITQLSYTYYYINVVRNKHWLDWKFLLKKAGKLNSQLVTVIVYFSRKDSPACLRNCLVSLKNASLYGHSKYTNEVILVDDSCNKDGNSLVSELYKDSLIDKYLINKNECKFPLSCNRAFDLTDGSFVVYLDSHSCVSVDWLDALVDPLKKHNKIFGTTAKILNTAGSIKSIGCQFDSVSGFPYDVFNDLPDNFSASSLFSLLPSVNSYCCAFRTKDVIEKNGLYCIYESALAVVDLCLQLTAGKPGFAYIPSSSVTFQTDEQQQNSSMNDLKAFGERWCDRKISYAERDFFARRNLTKFVALRKKVCSVTFKKYTTTSCANRFVDYLVPVYDFSKLGDYGCTNVTSNSKADPFNIGVRQKDESVTTVILTYNHELYISQTIESALMQNYDKEHKILISDDMSTDNTRKIIKYYADKYSNIITDISNGVNKGFSENRARSFCEVDHSLCFVI